MKKTAVEWYNEKLNLYGDMAFNKKITLGQYHIKKQELLEEAKEMEKEQIEDAYWDGIFNGEFLDGQGYYNENYGNK